MKQRHPHRESLAQFVGGELASEDAKRVERHLEVCSDCRDQADEIAAAAKSSLLEFWLSPGYEDAIDRAVDGAAERLTHVLREGRNAGALLAELLLALSPVRRQKVRREERF